MRPSYRPSIGAILIAIGAWVIVLALLTIVLN